MTVKTRWVAVMGIALLAFALFVGTALAQSDEPAQSEAPTPGWSMHAQMDPQLYGQMIQHMNEVHGPEFTAEMVQRMNSGETCHGPGADGTGWDGMGWDEEMGPGMMNGTYGPGAMFGRGHAGAGVGTMMRNVVQGVQNMMQGSGYMSGRGMMGGGMMGR